MSSYVNAEPGVSKIQNLLDANGWSPFSVLTTKVCILQIGQLNKEFVNFIQI